MQHVFHYVVQQTKPSFGFRVPFTSVKPIDYGQIGGGKTQKNGPRALFYTLIWVTKYNDDGYATPMQHQ